MNRYEQFITQSKINHLKRLGLCPNDDDEYKKLLHQIEQKRKEIEEEFEKDRELFEINSIKLRFINRKIQSYVNREFWYHHNENVEEYWRYHDDAKDIRELLSKKDLNIGLVTDISYEELYKKLEEAKKQIKRIEKLIKEEDIKYYYYCSNLLEIENMIEHILSFLLNGLIQPDEFYDKKEEYNNVRIMKQIKKYSKEISELINENEEIKDQFLTIIQEKNQLSHFDKKDDVEDDEEYYDEKKYDSDLRYVMFKKGYEEEDLMDIDLYNFFKNEYKIPNWKQYLEINQLTKYTYEYGHWYLQGKNIVLDISDEEYEKLCKISPPFLFRIEECIQEVYNKGYNEGHEDGYNEGYNIGKKNGYNNGYDDGYRMGD